MMKVAIIGSISYTNKRKIKDFIFKLKEKIGSDLEIVSGGGKYVVEKNVRDICIEFGISYSEIPPFHYKWNQDCIYPQNRYDKNYNVKYFFVQNKLIVEYVDLVIFFTEDEEITKINDLKRLVEKQNKSLIIKS